jgi:hypothetical protein
MDQQMKQLQGMGVNRDYLLQRQKSWQPGRRSPSRHFISDHQHHHHHHQPHAPHQNTPGDWKLDMSRMQTVRTTSLSPAPPVQGGFTFSSPKLESSFKGEEKKEGLVNPPDTGQQQQQEGGVIPEGGLDMVTYLLKAAEAAEVGNTEVAKAILARLNQHISPARGKPFHRVAYYFQIEIFPHLRNTTRSMHMFTFVRFLLSLNLPTSLQTRRLWRQWREKIRFMLLIFDWVRVPNGLHSSKT